MNLLNQKNIIIVVSALLVVGVGTYFYQQSCDQKEQAAKSALYQIQKTIETEAGSLTEADKVPGAKFDVEAKFSKSIAELNKIASNSSESARVRYEAGVKLGTMYLEYAKEESLPKAIEAFKNVSTLGKTSLQKASAYFLLGTAQERASLVKEAAESFQLALKQDNAGLKNEVLLSLVRINMKANDATKAKNYADQLKKDAPGSKEAETAQKLISKT